MVMRCASMSVILRFTNSLTRSPAEYAVINAGVLRLRGKQTGQISQQITGSAQQAGHPSFLVHLTMERKLSPNSLTGYCSGLRFFYNDTLGWDETKLFIPPRKKSSSLPEVFSPDEVVRLIGCRPRSQATCFANDRVFGRTPSQ